MDAALQTSAAPPSSVATSAAVSMAPSAATVSCAGSGNGNSSAGGGGGGGGAGVSPGGTSTSSGHREPVLCVSCGQFHDPNTAHLYDYNHRLDPELMCRVSACQKTTPCFIASSASCFDLGIVIHHWLVIMLMGKLRNDASFLVAHFSTWFMPIRSSAIKILKTKANAPVNLNLEC